MLTAIAWIAKRTGLSAAVIEFIGTFLLIFAVIMGCVWEHHRIFHAGEMAADARHAVIDKANSDAADKKRAELNAKIDVIQAKLNAAEAIILPMKEQLDHEKTVSADYQRRYVAGTERLRVLTRPRPADPDQAAQGHPAAGLGDPPGVVADLDGRVAADLEWLRLTREDAITRLDACIVRYQALKAAVDAMPQGN